MPGHIIFRERLKKVVLAILLTSLLFRIWNTSFDIRCANADIVKGDVDRDGDVDIFDLVRVANVYGVTLPDPRYDRNCDIDIDGDIDIFDLVVVAGNYARRVPQVQYHEIYWNATYKNMVCKFVSRWTTLQPGNLSHYTINHNASGSWSNSTKLFSYGLENAWVNVTFTMPPNEGALVVIEIRVNNTYGFSNTTKSGVLVWASFPTANEKSLGETVGGTMWGGAFFNNATATGGKAAIFVCYPNSTDNWRFYVSAFDLEARKWRSPYSLGWGGGSDTHWNPRMSRTPQGNLIITSGYTSGFDFQTSVYSSTTEGDLTKLISNWNAKVHVNGTNIFDYPEPVYLQNRLLCFGRKGNSITGNLTMQTWNGTCFVNQTTIAYRDVSGDGGIYWDATTSGDNILVALTSSTADPGRIGFVYSPDKGITWKLYNGTVQSLPIKATTATVCYDNFQNYLRILHLSALLDEYNRLVIFGSSGNGTQTWVENFPVMAQYSKGLGQSGGTWTYGKCYFMNGTQIKGTIACTFQDRYYGRPSGWGNIGNYQSSICKIVREYNETHRFRLIYQDVENCSVTLPATVSQGMVRDYPEAYEVVMKEQNHILSYLEKGQTQTDVVAARLYGTKILCNQTGTLVGASVLVNISSNPTSFYQIVVYNATYHLVAKSSMYSHQLGSSNMYRWANEGAFTTSPTVYYGHYYWVCFRIQYAGMRYFWNTGESNQSFYIDTSYLSDVPDSLDPQDLTFENKKVDITAYNAELKVRGIGSLPPTSLADDWSALSPWKAALGKTMEQNANANIKVSPTSDRFLINITDTGNWSHAYQKIPKQRLQRSSLSL